MRGGLVLVGAGEIAQMACEYFTRDSEHEVVAFAVGADHIVAETLMGRPVTPLEEVEARFPAARHPAFVAIGDGQLNRVRRRHYRLMRDKGYRLVSYVSSRAFVWPGVELGDNAFILEHNVLQPFVRIGNNVTLWSGNHIGHRSVVEDDVFVASHVVVSGFCRIGRGSFVGVNASLAPHVELGEDNYVGMGAAIAASTPPDTVHQAPPAVQRKVSARRFQRVRE